MPASGRRIVWDLGVWRWISRNKNFNQRYKKDQRVKLKTSNMINEIVNFTTYLEEKSPDIFSENIQLKEGYYFFVEKGQDGLRINENSVLKVDKNTERTKLYDDFLELVTNTEMLNAMKSFNSGPKIFIAIGSPFAISISGLGMEKDLSKLLDAVDAYFKAAERYIESENEKHITWMNEFKGFVKSQMFEFIYKNVIYKNTKKSETLFFFLREPGLEDYKQIHTKFLAEKLFNKDKFNIESTSGEIFGISNDLSGFNDSKEFLKHKTSPIELNYRISGTEAFKLYRFFQLQQKNKILPNPMPLFVDEKELTESAIKFYKNDKKAGHKEIIEELLKSRSKGLQNYYLIFFHNGQKGSRIVDLDFVPVFKYEVKDAKLSEPFSLGGKVKSLAIGNIFDFQKNIFNRIFNNQLITETKNGLWLKYFDDMEAKPEYGTTDVIVDLFYKYRRAFYDYVYKSKRESITCSMFYDMSLKSILDDIKRDKELKNTYRIKEKLNIWFSLFNFFNNPINSENMVNKTELLLEKIKSIAKPENSSEHIKENEEFAFAAGQLIRTILNKSESGERSHALLEPFLQKTDCDKFKLAIARAFENYKHAFKFYKGDANRYEFDKIMSEVMGFETRENLKNLLPMILAGYFSETIFKKEIEVDNTKKVEF